MYTMQVNINLDRLYCTVRKDADIRLGYMNSDFETFQETGRTHLEKGKVYELERVSGFDEVYALTTSGGVYRAQLVALLSDSNLIIFPIQEVLTDFISKRERMNWNA